MNNHIDKLAKIIIILLVSASLGACASGKLRKDDFEPPDYELTPPPPPPTNGSIFSSQYSLTLFRDTKASKVGDLITIILVEETTASKSADLSTEKENTIDIPNPTILGRPGNLLFNDRSLATDIETESEFAGSGSANQRNSLDGSVTVIVEKVLPNGNLVVRGQKLITINQGDEYVRVEGLIRQQDVTGDNTVLSTQVANAHFSYGGRGAIADASSQGWLARFFNSPYWPF